MALSKEQISLIKLHVKEGKLSNIKIGEAVGCKEATIRRTIKKYGLKKDEINELAKAEIQNIIIQDEIKTRKDELSPIERRSYDEALIIEARNRDLVLGISQKLLLKVGKHIDGGTKQVLKSEGMGDGVSKQVEYELDHDPKDLKDLADTVDKLSVTLGVNARHAPKADTTVNNLTVLEKDGIKIKFEDND